MIEYKNIVRNIFSNWANLIVSLGISFFMAPFILHKIGNVYFGVWALVTQVTGYLWLLDFGVRESIIKYVAEYHEKGDYTKLEKVISASLRMYSLICIICIAVSTALALFLPTIINISQDTVIVAQLVVIIVGIDIAQTFIFNVFIGILMGLQRYDIFSKISIGSSILRGILIFIFLTQGHGIVALALIQLCLNGITNIILYYIAKRSISLKISLLHIKIDNSIYKMILKYGFYVLLNNVFVQAIFYSSNLIIAIYLPISAVTYYAIAITLIDYMKKITWAATQVINPLASQFDAKNAPEKIVTLLINGTKFSLLLGLPIGTVFLLMGREFITLWMGSEYALITGNILAVLTVATIFSLPHYTITGILLGINRHKIIAYCHSIEAVVNIILSIVLIKYYGLIGVAFGAAIPHFIMVLFILPVIISRILSINMYVYIKNAYYGPLISIVPFAVVCYIGKYIYVPTTLLTYFGKVIIILPIYFITIWFITFTNDERKLCRNYLIRKVPV